MTPTEQRMVQHTIYVGLPDHDDATRRELEDLVALVFDAATIAYTRGLWLETWECSATVVVLLEPQEAIHNRVDWIRSEFNQDCVIVTRQTVDATFYARPDTGTGTATSD